MSVNNLEPFLNMIPIKINNKPYKIKSISELTTMEFIELSKIQELDLVKYIAWQTETSMDNAFFAVTSKTVENAIGTMPDITKLPLPKNYDYKKGINTVGQRHQVEGSNLSGNELLVFCLAVAQAASNNIDDVNALYGAYMDRPFSEVLPAGFFFFRNYKTGKKPALIILGLRLELIKMRNLKRLRVLRNLINIAITWRYRLYVIFSTRTSKQF